MIKSMTGFGKGVAMANGMALTVEIKTVNHRYCDISVKSPRVLLPFETDLKKRVGERLQRGKIDIFVNQEYSGGAAAVPTLNRPLAEAYVRIFEEMCALFPVEGGIPLPLVVSQRDVIQFKEVELSAEELSCCLDEAMGKALAQVEAMRQAEGQATQRDIEGRLVTLTDLLARIAERSPQVSLEWQAKLTDRLARLAQDVVVDPLRVAQEVAIFADRCDISEEQVRFSSHLDQFRTLLATEEAVGRQIDFLVQELNREANTMGSKSNDAELTRLVVTVKAELEKIREQVQNIE